MRAIGEIFLRGPRDFDDEDIDDEGYDLDEEDDFYDDDEDFDEDEEIDDPYEVDDDDF